jgi:Uma2 family endonuclease
VSAEKMAQVSQTERDRFFPGCPDWVVEVASASEDGAQLRLKMQEYMDNGAALGLLILPQLGQVEVYEPEVAVQCLAVPQRVSAGELMPGFELETDRLFKA